MRSGALKHQIEIRTPVQSDGEYGEKTVYELFKKVRANINPLSGRAFFEAKQNNHELTHEIRIWFLPLLTDKMRIYYDNREFEIVSLINVREQNKEHLIMCKEIT